MNVEPEGAFRISPAAAWTGPGQRYPMKTRLFSTVSFRTTLWFSVLYAISTILLLLGIYHGMQYIIQERTAGVLRAETNDIASLIQANPDLQIETIIRGLAESHDKNDLYIRVYEDTGTLKANSDITSWLYRRSLPPQELVLSMKDNECLTYASNKSDETVTLFARILPSGLRIETGHILYIDSYVKYFGGIIVFLALILLASASFIGFMSIKRVMNGVEHVSRVAVAVGNGVFDAPLPKGDYGAEIDELSDVIGEMRKKIERLMLQQREVVTNVAHDLRSPITRIRALAETWLGSDPDHRTCENMDRVTAVTIEDCDRLTALINTILEIDELNIGGGQEHRSRQAPGRGLRPL